MRIGETSRPFLLPGGADVLLMIEWTSLVTARRFHPTAQAKPITIRIVIFKTNSRLALARPTARCREAGEASGAGQFFVEVGVGRFSVFILSASCAATVGSAISVKTLAAWRSFISDRILA